MTPTDKLPAGYFSREIHLQLWDATMKRLPDQTVSVFGSVVEKIIALPEKLQLGPVQVGEVSENAICLQSPNPGVFDIVSIDCPPGTSVSTTERVGRRWRMLLRHAISQAGNASAIVNVSVRLDTGEVLTLPVTVAWFGLHSSDSK